MTQEEKARAYDEALERARANYKADKEMGFLENCDMLELIFPELAESEEERIRKEIINYIVDKADQVDEVTERRWIAWLEKQKEQKPTFLSPHKGDDNNPYDMGVSEAQDYAIKRGFGVPFNDGEVYVDERYITQTIGNILRWADEHPKEQKPVDWSVEDERIRKELVAFFIEVRRREGNEGYWHDLKVADILSYLEKQKEQKPLSSFDIVPYIDDKIAELLDMWREEKVAFNWDDMHEMIEDVALHFYRQEQKPVEWNEEDERMMSVVADSIYEPLCPREKTLAWLKSLRARIKKESEK